MLSRAFVFMALASVALPAPAADKLADAEIDRRLVGKWRAEYVLKGVNVTSQTEYRADGTFTANAACRRGTLAYDAVIQGTWTVKDSQLTETCTKCAPSDFAKAGDKSTDTVLAINDTQFKYRGSNGIERMKVRITSGN
jgi:hypothetical protein